MRESSTLCKALTPMLVWSDTYSHLGLSLTGMLALEMLGRRAHNDHPNNFSRSPPYTEDVKWLLGLAARLGEQTVHFGEAVDVQINVVSIINAHPCWKKEKRKDMYKT